MALSCLAGRAEVVISEFSAENDGHLLDADGDSSDWIELHNNGAAPVNLSGWHLSDDAQQTRRWPLPDLTLAAGARRVVFASGKDRRNPAAELHTNFSISNNAGGYLGLRKPSGFHSTRFIGYPAQHADISFGEGLIADSQDLVTATSAGRLLVPAGDSLGSSWTLPNFDDSGWTAASPRIGYQSAASGAGLPVAYWTFDDTTANTIASGPAAGLVGAAYDGSVPGAIGEGKSLAFTRASGTYAVADLNVSETAFSSSFWFRTTQATTGLFAVTNGNLGADGHDRHVYLSGGNIRARTWSDETISSSGKNYADNQWHHVAHVLGASIGGQRLYVDGVQVAAGSKAQSGFDWQSQVHIGFSNDAAGATFHQGQIDDVSVWSETLGSAAVASLASGTAPNLLAGFSPYIGTHVEAAMKNVNATAYLRLPFTVNRATPFNQVTLKLRYDDGFVAYLDGVEVARRNAPAGLTWQSAATADRTSADASIVESIDLSAHAGLLANGNHLLAIHALNDAAGSPEFLLDATLSAATLTPGEAIYLEPPTPGTANATGFLGFVADPGFSPPRGLYPASQSLTLSCGTPGATIAYTADGTDPSPTNGTQVAAPHAAAQPSVVIPITATRFIRAMAYKPSSGLRSTAVDSHSYLMIPQILAQPAALPRYPASWSGRTADYAMDASVVNSALPGYSVTQGLQSLPSISLTSPLASFFSTIAPLGIYYDTSQRGDASERKVSVEWINPDGSPGWHVQAGVRPHGNSSRGHGFTPKHPLRLNFRGDYGYPRLREDIYGSGVKSFDQLLLRACSTDSMPVVDGTVSDGEQRWNNDKATYIRDQYLRDLLNELGHPNCRGEYAHLYINGLYWGLYNLAERPTAAFFASTFGGEEEEWDVLKDFQELNDGNAIAWNEMAAIVNDAGISDAVRCQKLLGNNPDGTRNPAYPIYLHWPSFRDYMITHIAAGAEDWPDHNYWVGRRRGPLSEGFRFVAWDQEISNDSLTRLSGRGSAAPFESVGNPAVDGSFPFGPAKIYDKFRRVAPFNLLFRERVHELLFNGGALTPAAQRARWTALQATIDKAIVPESARWGDANGEGAKKRETTWLNNMNSMNTPVTGYWDAIHPIDVQRFRNVSLYPSINQPVFNQNGGWVPAGFQLVVSHPEPLIYYTLDGSDPMGPAGSPSPGALTVQKAGGNSLPFPLNGPGYVKTRARTAAGEWSGLNTALFTVGVQSPSAQNVVVSELHYHPAAPFRAAEIAVSFDPDEFEFIELMNVGSEGVDFTGAHLADGLVFDFPVGYTLAPGGRCAVVKNLAAFEARYGTGRAVAGIFGSSGGSQSGLNNAGETLALTLTAGASTTTLFSFAYDDLAPWPLAPDGTGPSLMLKNPAPNANHGDPANWVASADSGGSPATAADQITFAAWRNGFDEDLAFEGDDDGDGIANGIEYALLLDPLAADPGALPAGQLLEAGGHSYLAITFRHRPAADLMTVVETGDTLGGWTGVPDVVPVDVINHGDGSFTRTWRCADPVDTPGKSRQFLRIRCEIAP